MGELRPSSVDLILCDLPYGTTSCKWDIVIPFEPLWKHYKRLIKPNGAILLFGGQPFSSLLVCSNLTMYRYDYVWNKMRAANFLFGNKQPMKVTEYIHVFYSKQPTYNPQKTINPKGPVKPTKGHKQSTISRQLMSNVVDEAKSSESWEADKLLPKNIIEIQRLGKTKTHPTEKPVALLEHLIKTHSNEGDLVLDNCAGSGSTGEACRNLGRQFVLMEKNEEYCQLISKRLNLSIIE